MARAFIQFMLVSVLALFILAIPGAVRAQSTEQMTLHQRAQELYYRGRYAEAEALAHKAVELSVAEYGPENPNTGLRLVTLAEIYLAQRRYEEAETPLKKAISIFEETLSADDRDFLRALSILASLYHFEGRYAEAEPLYKRVLAIQEKIPNSHSYNTYIGLGALYFEQGRYAEAELHFKRVLSVREDGRGGLNLARGLNWLAYVYFAQGRYADAEPLLKRSLTILEEVRGDDPEIATLLRTLAETYAGQGRYADANEVASWMRVWDTREARDIEEFLRDYPRGQFADRAKQLLVTLRPSPLTSTPVPSAGQPTLEGDFAPGNTFKDCAKCPEMVIVPAGSFEMGLSRSERKAVERLSQRRADEKQLSDTWKADRREFLEWRLRRMEPQHRVAIGYAFAVGKYEVTFDEWDACVAAGGCSHRPKARWGRGRNPVVRVSWDDAKAYVAWLSQVTGKSYRLLSEAEWEYVSRIGDPPSQVSSLTGPKAKKPEKTVPVGSSKSNALGLHDLHGNVTEWVEDCWHDSYVGAPTDGSGWGECDRRVVRGEVYLGLRSAARSSTEAWQRSLWRGFRVARTLP